MKKKITFKMFFSVFGRGIWQAICWVGGMFGINDGSSVGKVAKRIFMVSLATITLIIACVFTCELVEYYIDKYRWYNRAETYGYTEKTLSPSISFMQDYYGNNGYVKDNITGEKLHENIMWISKSADGDSLAVYRKGDKRGYINRYTGELSIPAKYDKAWNFSEGVAAVAENGYAMFIDHSGKPIFDKKFHIPYDKDQGYAFHGGFSVAYPQDDNDFKIGLIDKAGNWALAPEYDNIQIGKHNYRILCKDNLYGLVDSVLNVVMPIEFRTMVFDADEDAVYCNTMDGWRKKFDLKGNILEDFIVGEVILLAYQTGEHDAEGNPKTQYADCNAYRIDYNHYGLLGKDGKPLTPAIYTQIDVIDKNHFECDLYNDECVILDASGRNVNKK